MISLSIVGLAYLLGKSMHSSLFSSLKYFDLPDRNPGFSDPTSNLPIDKTLWTTDRHMYRTKLCHVILNLAGGNFFYRSTSRPRLFSTRILSKLAKSRNLAVMKTPETKKLHIVFVIKKIPLCVKKNRPNMSKAIIYFNIMNKRWFLDRNHRHLF